MLTLAKDRFLGVPVALYVWAAVSIVIAFLLARTAFGRALYAIGTRERAAYLSGIRTRPVIIGAFIASSVCAALAGVMPRPGRATPRSAARY